MHTSLAATTPTVRLRVIVDAPPGNVQFAVQQGKDGLLLPTVASARRIQFDLELRVGGLLADGSPRYLGDVCHGTPQCRFVYLNSGTLAGQARSIWTRRAKLMLGSIPPGIAQAATTKAGVVIEAQVPGTMADGGPICAAIKPHAVAWSLKREPA